MEAAKNNSSTAQTNIQADTPTSTPKFLLPDALLILLLTGSCYLLTFWYESGFCSYFGIDPAFIHPDPSTMLGYGIGGILVLVLLFTILGMLMFYRMSRVDWLLNPFIPVITTVFIVGIEYMREYRDRIMFLSWCFFWICFYVLPLALKRRDTQKSPYKTYLRLSVEWRPIYNSIRLTLLIAVVYIFCGLAYVYGIVQASITDTYLCRDASRRELILRVYGSSAITARIDTNNNVFAEFSFIKLEGDTNIFKLTNIGKLHPQHPR